MTIKQTTAYVFLELDYVRDADGHPDYYAEKTWQPTTWSCRVDDNDTRIFVGAQTVSVEVPDDFNPTAKQVAALEQQKLEALERYRRTVSEINERLSRLQAIANEVTL